MRDRPGAWLQDAVLKMRPILLGVPLLTSALAMLHEGPWFGLEPDRIQVDAAVATRKDWCVQQETGLPGQKSEPCSLDGRIAGWRETKISKS